MALIDLSNYATTLHQASSSSFTDGNVFFDPTGNANKGTIAFGDATTYSTYTPAATTGSATIDSDGTAETFTITGANFLTLGFRAGMKITSSGYVDGPTNATFTIASITTSVTAYDTITIVETGIIATEAGGGDEQIVGAATTNALINLDGLRFEAVYAFENQERRADESLREYDRWSAGTFKFGGAYDFVNARTPAADSDRKLLRGSGWRELTGSIVNRIYFGTKGLGSILATSVPYYQATQYATAADFTKLGNIDEAVLVYEDDAGDLDPFLNVTLNSMYLSIRTYGQNYDRIDTGTTLGIAELGGYSTGAALNESNHLTSGDSPFASVADSGEVSLATQDVNFVSTSTIRLETTGATDWTEHGFGVGSQIAFTGTVSNVLTFTILTITDDLATNDLITITDTSATIEAAGGDEAFTNVQVAPWTLMGLEKLGSFQNETGFAQNALDSNSTDGDFTWTLNNTGSGTLYQCVAYLDAVAIKNGVATTGTASLNGKDYDVWYRYTPSGLIQPITGAGDGLGVYIEGLVGADKQLVSFIDDGGFDRIYPTFTPVSVELGQNAIDDTLAWFHMYEAALYNQAGTVTYQDAAATAVKGDADNTSAFITGANTFVSFEHDFTTDGTVNTVFLCEGDGGVTQQKTTITLADSTVSASCVPAVENNA